MVAGDRTTEQKISFELHREKRYHTYMCIAIIKLMLIVKYEHQREVDTIDVNWYNTTAPYKLGASNWQTKLMMAS